MLSILFVNLLVIMIAIRWWLVGRQLGALGMHRAVPAAFAATISAEDHAKANAYGTAKLKLARLELLWDAAVLLFITLGGGFAALDALTATLSLSALWHGVATLALLALILSLASLPFDLTATFRIEARFGFNRQTVRLYLSDLVRSTLLAAALGIPLLATILTLMTMAGERWWLYAWTTWVVFTLVLSFAWPRFIAPLFNHFKALDPGSMRDHIEQVLTRCGFASEGVFVMDGSRRSSHGNAYFTGFGRHKRIVLFDTLIERLTPTEVQAVLAHELGHFRLHHIRSRLVVTMGMALAGFWLLGQAAAHPGFYVAFGVPDPSPAAALALFFLVVPVFTFPLGPLLSLWSRRHEYQADRFAAEHASAEDLAAALVKLYRDNASALTPDPWYSAWHDSHPPALARIGALTALSER
jgi:STE24 endopeptidase